MLDSSARLLRLLAILQTRTEWTGPELAQRLDVTVRTLRRDMAEEVAERVPPTAGLVEAVDRRSCLLSAGADTLGFLALHLALLGPEFTVLEPAELADELGVLAGRLDRARSRSGSQRPE
ncbi:HTH domain-containing protein [Plantactinospora sp. KLBMP9567]|uniref:HTH domain-containing protein n=1 Tax=Plantactinospora sp. KLBMP9567 TaxID=3085900 RepID=UPI002980DFFB|nr:HTH domain-containing protein [Plantactinospora sp. KLBMP9567]MDW5326798.1 HTH domain-containing protein [Plantactinospora sp. KLBMP9567]